MGIASKIVKGGLKAVASKAPRMSEALNPHVGKRLYITQADRTALDYEQGLLGGPGYTELATIDPAKYKDIAWAVQSPGVAKTLVGSMARNPEEAVFANLIGSPEQHRSNKVVFDRIMKRFEKAIQEDKLTPELHATINKRLSNIKDPKTGKSFFPEDVDILSPEFNQHAQTFHQRAFIADVLAGKGVGGRKGTIIDYPQEIKDTTDQLLLEAKTGDIGNRLFSLSGNIEERPELHPAFHYSLSGKKESEAFNPAPQGIVLKNFTKDFTERTGRLPTYYDLTRGYAPSEKITDEMLERMYKEGYAGGGKVSLGKRIDNTEKETGFLGEIPTPRGEYMTEMSIGEPNTDELFRPSIVPNTHPAEINYMIQTGEVPTDLYPISQRHAEKRIAEGKSPFWNEKEDVNKIRDMIKSILGSDVEKADGGSVDEPEVLKEVPRTGKISGKIADVLRPAKEYLEKYEIIPQIPLIGGTDLAEITGVKGAQTLAEDISYGYKPIRNLERGKLQASYFDPRLAEAVDLGATALGGVGLAKNLGKTAIKEGMRQIETGTGMLGRNVINPRMNVIKDQGGMLVGGEKALDDELLNMKKNEVPEFDIRGIPFGEIWDRRNEFPKDPNALALNQWIDTKVKKYLRNQAGSEADPIRKLVDEGVPYNFSEAMGDRKYRVANKRAMVGKPVEGVSKTPEGKEWEYTVDSIFEPHSSQEIKDILNNPITTYNNPDVEARSRASKIRIEHDLPIKTLEDIELINQIPDKNVYTLSGTDVTRKLGLDHVRDVLYEDLASGKLKPEQLNQMSIEKAIRRTAEYDAEKAREMAKAHATSVEGMPVPKEYNDGYKWVELKHETDPAKTKSALKSEGEMMGHCVGGYCADVESGEVKIFSLRSPDGKSHVTIEARPQFSMTLWRNENMDLISRDPELMKLDVYMREYNSQATEQDYVREMTKEMKKRNINPIEPPSYMELHQVKGKQNKRPDDKYQSYISDFIKNNPTKHEIVDVRELDNTNLMSAQNVVDTGLVDKNTHNHPEVEKILKTLHPEVFRADQPNIPKAFSRAEELKYDLFKEAAEDLARQGKTFLDKDDILNHLREKYLLPKKKSGGSINLNQEYKLENMRRRYG
jgi:hypothetical protein